MVYVTVAGRPGEYPTAVLGLHQSIQPLPQGITPERYVTDYMAQDFSVGGNRVSDVKILFYENADISALNTGGITAKSMRISYLSNGVLCTGSFTVATYQTGVSTAVAYLWGIYSTSDKFYADAPDSSPDFLFHKLQQFIPECLQEYDEYGLGRCK